MIICENFLHATISPLYCLNIVIVYYSYLLINRQLNKYLKSNNIEFMLTSSKIAEKTTEIL